LSKYIINISLSLEETNFYEKIRKEAEDSRVESSYKFAHSVHANMDEFFERKISFFERIVYSLAANRLKYPNLSKITYYIDFLQSPNLEKYSTGGLIQDTFPGLKPLSNWPVCLDDLLSKLCNLSVEEMFHQPFDLNGDIHRDAQVFIKKYLDLLRTAIVNQSKEEEITYLGYLVKAVQAYITIKILEGSYTRMMNCMSFLTSMHNEYKDIFERVYEATVPLITEAFNILIKMYREHNLLPIMRNYSINDFFNISKNILFAVSKYSYSQCVSITTDSKYLYILLSGINGGMMKVGTGFEGTERGRVYLYKNNTETVEETCQWVFCKQRIYLKSSSTEIGYLSIIDPENFQKLSQIKLLLPECSQHSAIKKKNENYILLSDGEKLNVVILEPVINNVSNKEENKEKEANPVTNNQEKQDPEKKNPKDSLMFKEALMDKFFSKDGLNMNDEEQPQYSDDEECNNNVKVVPQPTTKVWKESIKPTLSDIYSSISLVLYTYNTDLSRNTEDGDEKKALVRELYDAFSSLYSLENCRKALAIKNWNIQKAANYLVNAGDKIREVLLLPEKTVLLFQNKLEGIIQKNANVKTEFKATKNSIMDVSQYETFKWAINKDILIAYKLRDGICYVFSNDPSKVREIKYQYNEDKKLTKILDTLNKLDPSVREQLESEIGNNIDQFINTQIINDKQETKEEETVKVVEEIIHGSYLMTLNSIQLNKNDNAFCFDSKNKIYYLLSNNSLISQSILVVNTYENFYNSMKDKILSFLGKNEETFLKGFSESISNFRNFSEQFSYFMLLFQSKKKEQFWRYRNWNYYYSYLFEQSYNV
jgi:hypothetical protein